MPIEQVQGEASWRKRRAICEQPKQSKSEKERMKFWPSLSPSPDGLTSPL
ncbi:hypothetical protein SESBI_17535 [Sesbania bispinosa]|nr:hypothetical protein SESBI_17535 [Sesbania bispinosa]